MPITSHRPPTPRTGDRTAAPGTARPYVWRQQQRTAPRPSAPGTERERATALIRAVAVAAVEVLAGARPARQLARWAEPEIVDRLHRRAVLLQRRRALEPAEAPVHRVHQHSEVRSQRVCAVDAGIYEAALVICDDARSRAVVVRAERQEQAWRITVLEVG
ncbi:UNVERIFIED_CONTAM: Rv3235 family protein [Kocuria sp. CPCC 205295]|uniref:Rv3235 family protein n=1 Tax=Kocuria TaxID=57493 RepID=UPI002273B3FA|nr:MULTISPECIES: Rv3235 family protein [Kocuria]MCY1683130.1 Rv3235 family protein [Kocuria sp. SL71]